MDQIKFFLDQMIEISDDEFELLISKGYTRKFRKNEILSESDKVPNEIYFIKKGGVRVVIIDKKGVEHTIHFAFESQIIADYVNFSKQCPSYLTLQAIEETETFAFNFDTLMWAFENLKQGQKLGRIVSDMNFFYLENRIMDSYLRTPKERYDNITKIFQNIHNRVPQHMIASYLGITSVHLSRLKRSNK